MTATVVVLSVVLALAFGGGGVALLAGAQPFAGNMDRLRVAAPVRTLVGTAEVAAAVGLLVGLAVTPLNVAAAVGLVVLMVGAVAFHARAHDPVREYPPAVVLGGLALALVVVQALRA